MKKEFVKAVIGVSVLTGLVVGNYVSKSLFEPPQEFPEQKQQNIIFQSTSNPEYAEILSIPLSIPFEGGTQEVDIYLNQRKLESIKQVQNGQDVDVYVNGKFQTREHIIIFIPVLGDIPQKLFTLSI